MDSYSQGRLGGKGEKPDKSGKDCTRSREKAGGLIRRPSGCAQIKTSGLQDGDSLSLSVGQVQVCGTARAFAAIRGDGSVMTWGDAGFGGDSSAVQAQLRNVHQIQANRFAFAAILGDGSVVTWVTLSLAVTAGLCRTS